MHFSSVTLHSAMRFHLDSVDIKNTDSHTKELQCLLRLVVIDANPGRNPRITKVWVMDPRLVDVKMTHYCLVMVDKK
jgi:hypothetical protein